MVKYVVITASYQGDPIDIIGKNITVEKVNTGQCVPLSECASQTHLRQYHVK